MVGQQLNYHVEVSWNGGTSKSSIKKKQIFPNKQSIFWVPPFMETPMFF